VLRGRNGTGKSHALRAIDATISGQGRPPTRDGETKGVVAAAGVTLTVARSTRRKGTLEVDTLTGKLDLGDIVDPGLKTAEAADAQRTRALIQVSGIKADPAMFNALVGESEDIRSYVGPEALEDADLLTMAGRVKRSLEAGARTAEKQADQQQTVFETARQACKDVDLDVLDRESETADELETAVKEAATLKEQREQDQRNEERRRAAKAQIERITRKHQEDGAVTTKDAEGNLNNLKAEMANIVSALNDLHQELERAEASLDIHVEKVAAARAVYDACLRQDELLKEAKEMLDFSLGKPVSDEQMNGAQGRVNRARQLLDTIAVAAHAKGQLEEANKAREEAERHAARAVLLRDAAASVDTVLTEAVGSVVDWLTISSGRWIVKTDRGPTQFAELSDGERWTYAVDVAVQVLGEGAMTTLNQQAWEGLDTENRATVAQAAHDKGILFVSAEADHGDEVGELRAELFAIEDDNATE